MTKAERNQKIANALDEMTKRASVSKHAARQALIKEGIYTASGNLAPEFGGPRGKKAGSAA